MYHHLVLLASTSVNKRDWFGLQIITDSLDVFCGKQKRLEGSAVEAQVLLIF